MLERCLYVSLFDLTTVLCKKYRRDREINEEELVIWVEEV